MLFRKRPLEWSFCERLEAHIHVTDDGEDEESLAAHSDVMKSELRKKNPCRDVVQKRLRLTSNSRRKWLQTMPLVEEFLDAYPAFKDSSFLMDELQDLTGYRLSSRRFFENNANNLSSFLKGRETVSLLELFLHYVYLFYWFSLHTGLIGTFLHYQYLGFFIYLKLLFTTDVTYINIPMSNYVVIILFCWL